MNNLAEFLRMSKADEHVWIHDVREVFENDPSCRAAYIRLEKLDGGFADFYTPLPSRCTCEERGFLIDYLCAAVFNMLSVYSGKSITVYCSDEHRELFESVFSRFRSEFGYTKVLNIARRLTGSEPVASFLLLSEYIPLPEIVRVSACDIADRINSAVSKVQSGTYCGIDVGGTDIKLAASVNGKLVAIKEYDWNPSAFQRAEQIKAPILLLAKLMAACVQNDGSDSPIDPSPALDKNADFKTMEAFIRSVEASSGAMRKFDGLALSFPDIIINNRIMGGETPKTAGIRSDPTADYEAELLSLSMLNRELEAVSENICAINDGPMATFSALCEYVYAGADDVGEVIAHSLGTDLGTGWIDVQGNAPQLPMECYDLLFDLGGRASKDLPPEDLRSLKNENSGMAGARRYLGQAGVYRLVYLGEKELIRDFVDESDGFPRIRMSPEDMRKPCLAYIMQKCSEGNKCAEAAFRQVGINLAQITREIEYLTRTGADKRWLFGRFVKDKRCFELISEGFASVLPAIKLIAADDGMASTPLMKQLAERNDVTVAQFAQAVSALYYAEYK